MAVEPVVQSVAHTDGHCGVYEIGRANLYGGGAGHEELDGVGCRHDAAESHNGNLDSLCHLPHHAQGHGLHGGTAQTARCDAQSRPTLLNVDGHAHQRVDERHGIGSFVLHGARNVGNVGHIGRQFHNQRLVVSASHCLHHAGCALAGHAEGHAALPDIGA